MAPLILTPSQTIGPFYGSALIWDDLTRAVAGDDPQAVTLGGTLVDGDGPFAYPSGVIEFWDERQFVRAQTDASGAYRVVIRRPEHAPPLGGRPQAPHLHVAIFGRGLLKPLLTRMYLPGHEVALAADPVFRLVPESRQRTLLAVAEAGGSLRFDLRVQGPDENVFFTR
jgi:protocatechuate 3,4-dioxygenase alpha subunit